MKLFPHKSNGPSLRYELAVEMTCGRIVWMNSPFVSGENEDVNIWKSNLKDRLGEGAVDIEVDGYDDFSVLKGLKVPDRRDITVTCGPGTKWHTGR